MNVLEKLNELNSVEAAEADKARAESLAAAQRETQKLDEVCDQIKADLAGIDFDYAPRIRVFTVRHQNRKIYVKPHFTTEFVRYSDDDPGQNVRGLQIDIGYAQNEPKEITTEESFVDTFARFLKYGR